MAPWIPLLKMRARRCFLVLAATLLWVASLALPASAHALLRATTPVDGQQVDTAPDTVLLEFNEPVSATAGAIRVFNADGRRIDEGDATIDGETVSLPVPPDVADGTFVVTWRATSADGHPVHGAFVYDVGTPSGEADSILAEIAADTSDSGWQVAAAALRFLQYAGALLAAGGVVFLLAIHDRRAAERAVLTRIVIAATAVTAVATVLGFGVQGALVTGLGAPALVEPTVLTQTLGSNYGLSAVVLLLGAALVVVGARRLWDTWAVGSGAGGTALLLGSFLLSGHTAVSTPRWLALTADFAHLAAGAAWFGGLVLLLVVFRRRRFDDDPVGAGTLVGRFSAMATIAVAAVSVAGLGLAWVEVRATRALFSTAYGWTLVAKVAAVAAILALGAYNKRRLVPAIQRAGTDAWRRLRTTVRAEVVGLCVVLMVTAVLVNLVPARDAAGVTGPLSTTVQVGSDYVLDVTVDPNRAGRNDMHLYLLTAEGRPVEAERFRVDLSMPSKDIGPIERKPDKLAPGHWTVENAELPIAGRWTVTVTAQVSRFSDATAEIPIDVGA